MPRYLLPTMLAIDIWASTIANSYKDNKTVLKQRVQLGSNTAI